MTIYGRIKKVVSFVLEHLVVCLCVGFVLWIAFFDQNSLLVQRRIKQNIRSLSDEKQYYIDKICSDSIMEYELKTNDNNLERFAREQYFMKSDDEDVYEIVEKP